MIGRIRSAGGVHGTRNKYERHALAGPGQDGRAGEGVELDEGSAVRELEDEEDVMEGRGRVSHVPPSHVHVQDIPSTHPSF